MKKTKVKVNKPIYLHLPILDISKILVVINGAIWDDLDQIFQVFNH